MSFEDIEEYRDTAYHSLVVAVRGLMIDNQKNPLVRIIYSHVMFHGKLIEGLCRGIDCWFALSIHMEEIRTINEILCSGSRYTAQTKECIRKVECMLADASRIEQQLLEEYVGI